MSTDIVEEERGNSQLVTGYDPQLALVFKHSDPVPEKAPSSLKGGTMRSGAVDPELGSMDHPAQRGSVHNKEPHPFLFIPSTSLLGPSPSNFFFVKFGERRVGGLGVVP